MTVKLATVTESIAALKVSGVTLKDIDEIPEEVNGRLCPILFPDPDNFVTSLAISRESYGADSVAAKNVTYTLNYIYLHAPAGSSRYITTGIAAMVNKVILILNEIADNSSVSGAVDITPRLDGDFGQLADPAGNLFFGARIMVQVLEYYEVS